MRFHELDPTLVPQAPPPREVAHLVVEPNKTCDLRCAACYCTDRTTVRTLEEVRADVDRGLALRNLETISIIGGEPTLHPDLPDMVRYVKEKGLVCQVLTNGQGLLRDDALLDALVAAGVDRFILHVDAGQAHQRDVDGDRHALARRLEARGTWFCVSLTVGPGQAEEVPRVLEELGTYRFFDGVLATLALDFAGLFDAAPGAPRPDPRPVHDALVARLGARVASVVPTSQDRDETGWLMYFHYRNVDTGAVFPLSPRFSRLARRLVRWRTGRHFFAAPTPPAAFRATLRQVLAAEILLDPRRLGEARRLLQGSPDALRFHYVVVQVPPHRDAEGRFHVCWQCPDAVVRHGRLLPVCCADLLDPLDGAPPRAPADVVAQVRRHLDEA